jgi:leucine-rich repeat-containing protein 49
MLTFQHNKIFKIENLISLPNLLYIDLYDNQIKEMDNLGLPSLKVLLLPKNLISKIKGIQELGKL